VFKAITAKEALNEQELDAEAYYHEGSDYILLEKLKDQLAVLPELDPHPPPLDLAEADVGELENTAEELAQMKNILLKHKSVFISAGNALPPPARGVVCDIEVDPGTQPIAQRSRRIPSHQLPQVYELLKICSRLESSNIQILSGLAPL
jgi:hypothetical protein